MKKQLENIHPFKTARQKALALGYSLQFIFIDGLIYLAKDLTKGYFPRDIVDKVLPCTIKNEIVYLISVPIGRGFSALSFPDESDYSLTI